MNFNVILSYFWEFLFSVIDCTFPQITLQSVVDKNHIDELGNAKANIFSVLDCFSGFFQLKFHPETKHKTGIITESGCWQFKKLPFGLMNSPAAFTMVMTKILSGLIFKFALAYIDDVLLIPLILNNISNI